MKALWVVLGVLGLIVLVALFAGGSYVQREEPDGAEECGRGCGVFEDRRGPAAAGRT